VRNVNKWLSAAAERSHDVQLSSDDATPQSVIRHVANGNTVAVTPAGSAGVEVEKSDAHRPTVAPAGVVNFTAAAAAAAAGAVKIAFPLSEAFEPLIACHVCFADGKSPALAAHNCQQDVLVVQSKENGMWFRIRERINHTEFAGRYHMCNQQPNLAIGKRCPRGDHCTFAHSDVECALWMAEKLGRFNINQFISQSGSQSMVAAKHTIKSLLAKHPGQLAFLCGDCYLYNRRVSMQSPDKMALCSVEIHDWSTSAILAHCSLAGGNITLISQCPATVTDRDLALCLLGVFCRSRWTGECTHAHSVVERDLWYVQRDCGLTQQQIVQQVGFRICIRCYTVCVCMHACMRDFPCICQFQFCLVL